MAAKDELPKRVRVSLGSAMVMGLLKGKLDAEPTTAYLMTYKDGKCNANCSFCPQARESHGRADMLSRVSWPDFPTENVLGGLEKAVRDGRIKRVCLQALNYPQVFVHLIALTAVIHQRTNAPVSISCQPLNGENIRRLAEAGAERVGIPLDAATAELFHKVKGASVGGPYDWERQFKLFKEAVDIFGRGRVSTHLIVGLGETEEEMVAVIQRCVDMGVIPSLFAFTPIQGTALEGTSPPSLQRYRRVQVARYLIVQGIAKYVDMGFDADGCLVSFGVDEQTLARIVQNGEPFLTSGCPDCNRPYYNEKPSGPLYNYPRSLTKGESASVKKQLGLSGA